MTQRENLLSLFRRQGYEHPTYDFFLCPSLYETFKEKTGEADYWEYFNFPYRFAANLILPETDKSVFLAYYDEELHPNTHIDSWGIAREPGSKEAMHMTRMRHPLAKIDSLEEMKSYPFPDFSKGNFDHQAKSVEEIHKKGLAAFAGMGCTIWETAWYMRSMEELMTDMITEDPKAEFLLDTVTESSCINAAAFARANVDVISIGDDIGMQHTIMMSQVMYRTWLKPRIKKVIDAAKAVKPDVLIMYHSCGYIKPFIEDLIEVGVDILDPVQPECMSFEELHREFGDRLSFHGTIGTQTTMPFGTPEEITREVHKNLKIAGEKGGLMCAPTHLLEPEVPWENILAFVEANISFTAFL